VESCDAPMESSSEIVFLVVLQRRYFYKYNGIKLFWPELAFIAGTRPAGCPCWGRSPTHQAPSHWASRLDYLLHFRSSMDMPCCGITSSGLSPIVMGNLGSTASARTHQKFNIFIIFAAANGVRRNLFIWYLFYFLSSSEHRAETQTRRKA